MEKRRPASDRVRSRRNSNLMSLASKVEGLSWSARPGLIWSWPPSFHRDGPHGPVVISLASQVEGSSRGATWPDLKLAAFFPLGPRWQVWLEHCANYYMPPTTTYVYTGMHVGKYVSYLPKVGGFLRVLWFPPPIKLTCHDMTLDVESGVKHQLIQSNLSIGPSAVNVIRAVC